MAKVRRRVLRNQRPVTAAEARRRDRLQQKREQLDKERAALKRWMSKLTWAFHAMEKLQAKIGRIERDIGKLEQN